jgi:uncharacterized protein (UPF0333 family)
MSKQSSSVILIGLLTIVLAMMGAAVLLLRATGISVIAGLPMLAVGAVIVLVILLCLLAVVFAMFDLQDRTQALALPEGSIRAVIALMLIVLFAILSIYLYGSLATSQLVDLGPAETTAEAVWRSQFGANYFSAVSATDGKLHGYLRNTPPQDSVDFAKQLLVLVGTLVTSIASFYFGSKAASPSVSAATEPPRPSIENIDQLEYLRGSGPKDVTLTGANLEGVSAVMFKLNGRSIGATISSKSTNRLVLKLDIPETQASGIWQLVLVDSKLGEQRMPQGITVT